MLIGLLSKVSKVETLQYLLTVLMRVIETNTDSVALFHKSAKGTSVPSWQVRAPAPPHDRHCVALAG